jgi:hypothetical protein
MLDALAAQDERLWAPGDQDAALTRLRAGVHGRIVARRNAVRRPEDKGTLAGWSPALVGGAGAALTSHVGTVSAGLLAVAAGFWVGWLQVAQSSPADLLGFLQAGPLGPLGW